MTFLHSCKRYFAGAEKGPAKTDLERLVNGEIVIEVKYAKENSPESECRKALDQNVDKRYTEYFKKQGVKTILKYGIACRIKECKVLLQREEN